MSLSAGLWIAAAGTVGALATAVVAQVRQSHGVSIRLPAAQGATGMMTPGRDEQPFSVFLSYASVDAGDFASDLASALRDRDLNIWYLHDIIKPGDSIDGTIEQGLAQCRYGVVILSPHFFDTPWSTRELNALEAREAQGTEMILPIWHGVALEDIRRHAPPLADRLAMKVEDESLQEMADKIAAIAR
jgi:TIR domain